MFLQVKNQLFCASGNFLAFEKLKISLGKALDYQKDSIPIQGADDQVLIVFRKK
jgi:hypothetical protein